MKVLALDSSGLVASVAIVEGDTENSTLLAEYTVNYKKTHSQTLLPMLDEIVKMIIDELTGKKKLKNEAPAVRVEESAEQTATEEATGKKRKFGRK